MNTILAIDDDEDIHKLLKVYLKNKYELISVMNGKEALKLLETFRPDLILLDMEMPEMNGQTFKKIQEENPELNSIPVIYLTADTQFRDKLGHKFDYDFLNKPIEKEDLLLVLDSFFKSSRQL